MSDASPMDANFVRQLEGREQAIAAAAALRHAAARTAATAGGQALRASAQRIDPKDPAAGRSAERRRTKSAWQADAWDYYDNVPEMGFGGRFFGNNLSKLRLFAGYVVTPGQPPVPVDATDPDGVPYLSEATQLAAAAALARIESQQGGHAELLRDYGINLWVAGECTLLALPDEASPTGEAWNIYSSDELVRRGSKWLVRTEPGQQDGDATTVPDDAPMYRLWVQHPRWSALPDSPTRRVLEVCDELMLLTRSIRAGATSRIPRGVFVVPEGALKGPADVTTEAEGDGEALADPTVQALVDHFVTGISEPGSASAIAPYVLAVPDELVDSVKYLEVGSVFSADEARTRDELIRRLANGVDLPPEILLGLADVNHWTAWQIDEQTFKSYLEPYAQNFVLSLTWAYYRPALKAAGITEPERFVIWYDETELVGHGDMGAAADTGAAAGYIGESAWRRYRGFAEADAPTPEEDERRLALQRGAIDSTTTVALLEALGILTATGAGAIPAASTEVALPEATVAPEAETTPGPPELPDMTEAPPATIAAAFEPEARSLSLDSLARRLGQIDQALRARLTAAADASMRRALERAGARLRSKALRASIAHRDTIDGVPNELVAARLGEAIVAALGEDTDTLLADSFAELRPRFDSWVERAQRQSIAEMARAGVELDEVDLEQLEQAQRDDREGAWALLLASLVRQANAALYAPDVTAPPVGEFDGTVLVPPSVIRETLSRAGGAIGTTTDGGAVLIGTTEQPAGAVATGTRVADTLATVNIRTAGFVWLYGDPGSRTTNFVPHEDLDGVEFQSFTSPVLANDQEWPDVAYFRPGDHLGCQCDFEPVLTDGTTDTGDGTTLTTLEV